MPELDAEHRNQLAEAVRDVLDRCTCTPFPQGTGPEIDCPMHGRADFQGLAAADALAPLVAGWLAGAWDAGWESYRRWQLVTNWAEDDLPPNPYRGGDDG